MKKNKMDRQAAKRREGRLVKAGFCVVCLQPTAWQSLPRKATMQLFTQDLRRLVEASGNIAVSLQHPATHSATQCATQLRNAEKLRQTSRFWNFSSQGPILKRIAFFHSGTTQRCKIQRCVACCRACCSACCSGPARNTDWERNSVPSKMYIWAVVWRVEACLAHFEGASEISLHACALMACQGPSFRNHVLCSGNLSRSFQ